MAMGRAASDMSACSLCRIEARGPARRRAAPRWRSAPCHRRTRSAGHRGARPDGGSTDSGGSGSGGPFQALLRTRRSGSAGRRSHRSGVHGGTPVFVSPSQVTPHTSESGAKHGRQAGIALRATPSRCTRRRVHPDATGPERPRCLRQNGRVASAGRPKRVQQSGRSRFSKATEAASAKRPKPLQQSPTGRSALPRLVRRTMAFRTMCGLLSRSPSLSRSAAPCQRSACSRRTAPPLVGPPRHALPSTAWRTPIRSSRSRVTESAPR